MLVLTEQCSCLLGPRLCCPPPRRPPPPPPVRAAPGPCRVLTAHSTHAHRSSSCCHGHTGTRVCCTHAQTCTHVDTDTGTHAMDMGTQTHVHMHTRAHPNTCTWKHRCKLTNVHMYKHAHGHMHTHGHGHMQAHPWAHTRTGTPALAHPVTQQILGLRTCLLPRHCLFCQLGVQPWAQPAL